jgi:uncharacterized protein YjbJ (UPF0337 family)
MEWQQVQGNWQQFTGKVRQQWGKLTDQDLERIGGAKDRLVGAIKQRYGYEMAKASKEVDAWIDTLEEKIKGRGNT